MNLEDRIRSSAGGQSNRYHPADDLIPRIEHRRRQRVARRLTASGIAAVVLFGGGALTLSSLRDRGGDDPAAVAESTAVTIDSTVETSTTTSALDPTTTTAPATPTTVPSGTVTPPITQPTTPPRPVDADVPMPYANPDGSTGVQEFWNIPQYGSEAVRGSGCGSSGQIGTTIPDGLWAGFITGTHDNLVDIDILCIYYGTSGQSTLTANTATMLNSDPEYLIVNNNDQPRAVPIDGRISLRLSTRIADGRCMDTTSTTQWSDIPPDRQVWIRIHNGAVTWVLADCAP